ncbi:hypothetical protein MUP65_02395 [Patescibacteria group bacterium]|nr:hypothetical protein [Patescibacteria group bacterium]
MNKLKLRKLKGANLDIDLVSRKDVSWPQDSCPWNEAEKTKSHRCAVKNVSICKFFRGVESPDKVLCSYPGKDFSRG